MITLKDFMEVVNYRITEGSDYGWNCYGDNAHCLDSWNGEQDGYSLSIIFDTKFQTVYEVQAHDYRNNRAYRLIHPDCVEDHRNEASERTVSYKEAWDSVDYVDLETAEDFLDKARAIVAGEDYDTRVAVPLTLPDDVLFEMMKRAHEEDITLNQFVENILKDAIDREKQLIESLEDSLDMRDEYDFSNGVRSAPAKMKAKKKKGKK